MAQVTSAAIPTPDAERENSPLGSNPGSEDLEGTKTKLLEAQKRKSACVQQSSSAPTKKPRLTRKVDLSLLDTEKEKETIEAACGLLGIAGIVGDDLGTSGFMKDLAGTSAASGEEFDPTFLELLEHNFGLYSTEPAVEGINVEEDKKAEAEHESKTAVDRLRFLEKENERLREVNDKLRKDLIKIEDDWDTTDRKYKALQKDFDENLTVIENLRDAVVRESDAAKEAKTEVSSLELKLKETEDSLASSKTLDAEKMNRIFDSYSSSLKQFGATPYSLPKDLNIDNFLSWIEEEFAGLGDVFSIAGDNFALTCTDGLGRFLEKEDKQLLLRVSDFWNAYGRDMAKDSSSKEETEDAEAEERKEEEDEEEEDDALDLPRDEDETKSPQEEGEIYPQKMQQKKKKRKGHQAITSLRPSKTPKAETTTTTNGGPALHISRVGLYGPKAPSVGIICSVGFPKKKKKSALLAAATNQSTMIYRSWSLLSSTVVIWGGIATTGLAGIFLFGGKWWYEAGIRLMRSVRDSRAVTITNPRSGGRFWNTPAVHARRQKASAAWPEHTRNSACRIAFHSGITSPAGGRNQQQELVKSNANRVKKQTRDGGDQTRGSMQQMEARYVKVASRFFLDVGKGTNRDGGGHHHFLDACFLCKRDITTDRHIFMYRGDAAFCSDDCRQDQRAMDAALKAARRRHRCLLRSASLPAAASAPPVPAAADAPAADRRREPRRPVVHLRRMGRFLQVKAHPLRTARSYMGQQQDACGREPITAPSCVSFRGLAAGDRELPGTT
ncbi:hypothetical protein HU200_056445 [Digitaria exilis]|uniref:FLZ-type domain-containing protein n=1 Tax=Digitaria exilis TaxID=1010633 RepID=A0A835E2H4_9POAL|nr:hypothetical protein HU200_056445 [Digitaria exilis]